MAAILKWFTPSPPGPRAMTAGYDTMPISEMDARYAILLTEHQREFPRAFEVINSLLGAITRHGSISLIEDLKKEAVRRLSELPTRLSVLSTELHNYITVKSYDYKRALGESARASARVVASNTAALVKSMPDVPTGSVGPSLEERLAALRRSGGRRRTRRARRNCGGKMSRSRSRRCTS